jgi:hypothetical protein
VSFFFFFKFHVCFFDKNNFENFRIEAALTTKDSLKDEDSKKNGKIHLKGIAAINGGGLFFVGIEMSERDRRF